MAAGIYEAVKEAMQDLVAPQLASVNGAITAMRGEMNGLRGEMAGLRGELKGEIAAVRSEVHALDERLTIALDLRERIVAIEAKLQS